MFAFVAVASQGRDCARRLAKRLRVRLGDPGSRPEDIVRVLTRFCDDLSSLPDDYWPDLKEMPAKHVDPDEKKLQGMRSAIERDVELVKNLPPGSLALLSSSREERFAAVASIARLYRSHVEWLVGRIRRGPTEELPFRDLAFPFVYLDTLDRMHALDRGHDGILMKALFERLEEHHQIPDNPHYPPMLLDECEGCRVSVEVYYPAVRFLTQIQPDPTYVLHELVAAESAARRALLAYLLLQYDRVTPQRSPWERFPEQREIASGVMDEYVRNHPALDEVAKARVEAARETIGQIDKAWLPPRAK